MPTQKRFKELSLVVFLLAVVVCSSIALAAYINGGIVTKLKVTVTEPISVKVIKELPTTLAPGDEAEMEFLISNTGTKTYLLNCTVVFPSPSDGLGDGKGFDVVYFIVNGEDRTKDLLDDGVAHIALSGGASADVKIRIKAHADVPAGTADITFKVVRSVVLNDPPKYIHLSWAVNDVYHTITIMWWTKYEVSGNTVVYDTEHHEKPSEYKYAARAKVYRVCSEKFHKCFPGYWHEVTLYGLKPGTVYYFRVGGPGGWSKEYKFRTLSPDQTLKIVITGDSRRPWGEGMELKREPWAVSNYPWSRIWLAKAIAEEDPDLVVFVGDMVNRGNIWENWAKWFEDVTDNYVTPDGRMIPIVAVIGNHEMGSYPNVESTYEWFKGLFANPGNELWFSLDLPHTHLTVLATTGGCVATWWEPMVKEAEEQVKFLEEDLAHAKERWKIVAFHVPYYDCFPSGTGYPSEVLLKYWAPIIEKYGVDFVFCGHVHNYMRTWPLKTVKIEEVPVNKPWTKVGYKHIYELKKSSEEGTTYVVVGTAGAPIDLYIKGSACDIRPFMAQARARHLYVLLEINETNVHYVAKDARGLVWDEVTYPFIVETFTTPTYNVRI